jgi:hypothetical protein
LFVGANEDNRLVGSQRHSSPGRYQFQHGTTPPGSPDQDTSGWIASHAHLLGDDEARAGSPLSVKSCLPQVRQTTPPCSPNHECPTQREPQADVLLLDHPCSDAPTGTFDTIRIRTLSRDKRKSSCRDENGRCKANSTRLSGHEREIETTLSTLRSGFTWPWASVAPSQSKWHPSAPLFPCPLPFRFAQSSRRPATAEE